MGRKKLDLILENVKIEAVAAEGKSLAHVDGTVVFVEFAVPGDIVNVKVTKKKKNYMEGFILEIVKPSEDRLQPFCEHFGICGGCRWQPLPYDMQLKAKQQQVWDQLVRIGHLEIPDISPILPSDKTKYYRNKLEFTFSNKRWIYNNEDPDSLTDEERLGLGFHVGKFFDKVLDIKHCSLQPEPSNEIRLFIREYAVTHNLEFYNIRENTGFLRNIIIRNNQVGDVMLTVCFAYDDQDKIVPMLDAIAAEFPQIKSLHYVINEKLNDSISDLDCILYKGEDAIWETMGKLKFKIGPKSFYQTNSEQAYKLYSVAKEFAALTGNEVVYDLYTGTGTIAQFISDKASKVIGIEYVKEAIEDARINAEANGITNCTFFDGDMKDILTADFIKEHGKPEVMIIDPPRAGMHPDVVKVIMEAAPERIVYVSCNPASQARDLAMMSPMYEITAVQPVDMFPHTMHVENVCALKLKDKEEE
ncbi:MAG: 23S rRNA (uracil(1939)-C(5))-methyltransferase RlmD [Bacteroidales bacterium]|jgi:23S rRNA (uracil1939-C5)-methyltransferase|nr:23S rRNA (uracil(1939)-C(5))-methyltransferase RlmD [Bacteroidales bacterium]